MTFANTMSLIAVFVALGGTSYAAIKIPRNAVGAAQIKTGGVGSSEVKNGALRLGDFKASELLRMSDIPGMKGDKGDKGDPGTNGTNGTNGADGTADAFARVEANGAMLQPDVPGFPSQIKGIAGANVVKGEGGAATGNYCFGGLEGQIASAQVSLDNADAAAADRNLVASVAIDRGQDLGDCPATHNQARVRIVDGNTQTATDARFFIWFEMP
jgi:hypothetical protein